MTSIRYPKWPSKPFSLICLAALFVLFFSFAFSFIATFLVPPPDAVTYGLIAASTTIANFTASSYHFGYYIFNILVINLSDLIGVSPIPLIVSVNVLCSYVSLYFLVRFLDLFLHRLNNNINCFDFSLPNRTRSVLFLVSPLSPFVAWIPYNLKDSQVVALSSIMLYSICFIIESIFTRNTTSRKFIWISSIFIASFVYSFTLRSYFSFSVIFFGTLFYYILTRRLSGPPIIKFVLYKSRFKALVVFTIALLVITALAFDILLSRFIAFSGFHSAGIATIFFNFAKFFWGPLFWSISPSYPLLYASTLINIVLWLGFGYLLFFKSRDPFRRKLCALAFLFMFVVALPYCIHDIQVGPRYRFFADMILYICVVYGFFGSTRKFFVNQDSGSLLFQDSRLPHS